MRSYSGTEQANIEKKTYMQLETLENAHIGNARTLYRMIIRGLEAQKGYLDGL